MERQRDRGVVPACFHGVIGENGGMTIELPPKQSKNLKHLVDSVAFGSPLEVISEGLRLLEALEAGSAQVHARKVTPFDAAAVGRIKNKGRKLLAAEQKTKKTGHR